LPFHIVKISIKGLTHLTQNFELLNSFNVNEGESCKGFEPEGKFSCHPSPINYNIVFTRIEKNMEEDDENDPNTNKTILRKDEM
jgi:hypothetical protein